MIEDDSVRGSNLKPATSSPVCEPAGSDSSGGGNHGLDNDRQVFFYERDYYVLSNFSAFNLKWKGLHFDTSEAAYQAEKFTHRPVIAGLIRLASSAHEAFKIAERYKAERRTHWDDIKLDIMLDILRAKAAQHEYVRRKLLATGDRVLIEDSWRDGFWGWGANCNGQNWLGKLWMHVRAELRESKPASRDATTQGGSSQETLRPNGDKP